MSAIERCKMPTGERFFSKKGLSNDCSGGRIGISFFVTVRLKRRLLMLRAMRRVFVLRVCGMKFKRNRNSYLLQKKLHSGNQEKHKHLLTPTAAEAAAAAAIKSELC